MDPLEVKRMREEHEAEEAANRPPPVFERIAHAFHDTYIDLAPSFGWSARARVPWDKLPEGNKQLMLAVVGELISQEEIVPGTRRGQFTG